MKLPKLYRVIKVRFSSLRDKLCHKTLGVMPDQDVMVTRKCRRVLCSDGCKWQLADRGIDWFPQYDETDQEILNEIGMDLSLVEYENL